MNFRPIASLAGSIVGLCLGLCLLAPAQAAMLGMPGADFGVISQSGSDSAFDRNTAGTIQPSLALAPLQSTSSGVTVDSAAFLQGQVQPLNASIDWGAHLSLAIGSPATSGNVILELSSAQPVIVNAPPAGVTEVFFAEVGGGLVSGEVAPGASVVVSSIAFIVNAAGDVIFQFIFQEQYDGGTLGLVINDPFDSGGLTPLVGAESGFTMFVQSSIAIVASGSGTTSIDLDPSFDVVVVQDGTPAAVPEPGTLSMFAGALLGLFTLVRRQRQCTRG